MTPIGQPDLIKPPARGDFGRVERSGFTLVEMVVVVAVIVLLVTIVLPAVNTLWGQRLTAEAENTIKGLLLSARTNALRATQANSAQFSYYDDQYCVDPTTPLRQATGGEAGLLFFVDPSGEQRVVSIAQLDNGDPAWENVFGITPDRDIALPEPMRVVPRYAVVADESAADDEAYTFTDEELANNNFGDPDDADFNVAQRHRNFFTLIYSRAGELLPWRQVLVYDEDVDADGFGDRTGLAVGAGVPPPPDRSCAAKFYYFDYDGSADGEVRPIAPPLIPSVDIPYLITGGYEGASTYPAIAINLPSVDGLLVYDDALFNEVTGAAGKRAYLLEFAQPFYINRVTGEVIRGPREENVAP